MDKLFNFNNVEKIVDKADYSGWVFIISLIVVILLYTYVLPQNKRNELNSILRKIHDFLNIRKLMLESIFRFLYVFSVVSCVVSGLFEIGDSIFIGILTIIFGPIISRIIFELFLLGIIRTKAVMDIRDNVLGIDSPDIKLSSDESDETKILSSIGNKIVGAASAGIIKTADALKAKADVESAKKSIDDVDSTLRKESKDISPTHVICSKCGYENPADSVFCQRCGDKIQ